MPKLSLAAAMIGALLAMAQPSEAALIRYQTALSPEVTGATGSGSVTADYDWVAHTLQIAADWSGLSGTTTVAHVHCCTTVAGTGMVGVAVTPTTLPGFPAGLTAGSYTALLDLTQLSTYTPAFVTAFAGGVLGNAEGALIAGFDAGEAYFNVHTSRFGGGEIRGFLQSTAEPAPVPEPATLALVALGLVGIGWGRRQLRMRG